MLGTLVLLLQEHGAAETGGAPVATPFDINAGLVLWTVGIFVLLMGLLALGGTLALCLGVFVAIPLIFICTVHLYEHIYGPNRAEDMLAG